MTTLTSFLGLLRSWTVAVATAIAVVGVVGSWWLRSLAVAVACVGLVALVVVERRARSVGYRLCQQALRERDARCTEHVDLLLSTMGVRATELAARVAVALQHGIAVDAEPMDVPDLGVEEQFDRAVADAATYGREFEALQRRKAEEVETLRLAVVALGRRVQASAHRIQAASSLLAERYSDLPEVVEGCMRIDHAAAQQARNAQSLAVLCGGRPGQQWQRPLPLVDVVRAASGRIEDYLRVEVAGDQNVAVVARVAEPLIHLVAEALANGVQCSPPTSLVTVTVRRVERGAVVQIDDGGVGLGDHRLARARRVASGEVPVGLEDLGEIPQMGLPVIGRYARDYGLRVGLDPSPYGGIRVVVLVPQQWVATVEPPGTAPALPAVAPAAIPAPVDADSSAEQRGAGLPRRRTRRGEASSPASPPSAQAPGGRPSGDTPEQAAAFMGGFLSREIPGGTADV